MPSSRAHSASHHSSRKPYGSVSMGAKVVACLLLALVALAPWPFGGVEMTRWLWPIPLAALTCWLWMLGRSSSPSPVAPWAFVPVGLALAFAAFQLTPLSGETLGSIAPKSLQFWTEAQSITLPIKSTAIVNAPISLEPEAGRLQMTWLALGLCVFLLSSQFLRSEFGMVGLFGVTTVVGAGLAVFAIIQGAQYQGKMYWFFEIATKAKPFGPFINRNHGGAFLNLCLAGAVGLLWYIVVRKDEEHDANRWSLESEGLKTRVFAAARHLDGTHILGFAAVAFILGGLVASFSRGAVASAAAGLGAAMIASRLQRQESPRSMPLGMYVLAIGLFAASMGFVYLIGAEGKAFARFNTLLAEPDSGQKSRSRHWADMKPAVNDFKTAGAGLGSYLHVHRLYTPNNNGLVFEHADNTYLEILVEMGIVGITLVGLFVMLCMRAIYVVLSRDRSPIGRAFAVGAAYVLGTQVLHHAVDFPLYSPANLILFSAWMGAVCGRAGRLALAARLEDRRIFGVAVPIGRWQAAGALPAGLLLALAVWASWEGTVQEHIDWKLREHRLHPATAKTTTAEADRWVQDLDRLASEYPNRANLRFRLAERWIDRCRVQATEAVLAADPNQKADDVWRKSDLVVLYAQVFAAARRGQGATLEAIRKSKAVSDNLPRAKEHLLAACQLSPLFVAPRIRLAEMPYLLDSPARREMLVDQAAELSPGDAEVMFRIGLLEFHADRRDNVLPAWRKSLEISQEWVQPIFSHCVNWIGFDRAIAEVVPPEPKLLVAIAEQMLWEPKWEKQRKSVLDHALVVLPQSKLSKFDRNETAGKAFLGLKQYDKAAHCLEDAVAEVRNRPYLWLSLAEAYEKMGKYREASRAMSSAAGLLPLRKDLAQQALNLRRKVESVPETPSTQTK